MVGDQRESGAVYVEFLIVIIPLLILMFSLVQMSLFLSAGILTRLAAVKAARSAMVIIDDEHDGTAYEEDVYHVGKNVSGAGAYKDMPRESRYQTIRMAARAPLIPVSPTWDAAASDSIAGALQNMGIFETAAELANMGWTWYGVGMGFVDSGDAYVSTVNPGDDVRVRVVFLYPCFVPIGKSVACHAYVDLPSEDRELVEQNGKPLSLVSTLAGGRFVTLRAEAPIPVWDR